ncbi:MAG: hypothetical protein CO129_03665 [Ignavibacteriales bacterium CG_4_9_14_3_um_filter_34_10]|nr:MAG: hypothetical protein CO129_03665 [Ignavibacteriales bacterium CG_4_9_14_3_um_filter_34_10]
MEGTIAVFIPIIFILVTGLVIITTVYFKSREKQLMIEKGLTPEQIFELINIKEKENKNKFLLLKGGIITIFLVIGGIIGSLIDRAYFYHYEIWEGQKILHDDHEYGVWLAFLGLGIGAVLAHFVSIRLEKKS